MACCGFCGMSYVVQTLCSHFVGLILCVLWGLFCGVNFGGFPLWFELCVHVL
jgi:hypothetical protein